MKIKKNQLQIGTIIYQYSSKILEYKIIKINKLESETHTEVFYELECLSCADHDNCKLAVKFDDSADIVYSHMLNNYYENDDGDTKNHEYYWHKNYENHWFLTRKEARIFIHNKNISFYNKMIYDLNEKIDSYKKSMIEENDRINALIEETDV